MAIVRSIFLKSIKKSMGDNTFCRWRGKNILKGKVETNKSNTLLQQKQRLRMKTLVELCDVYDPAIEVGFPNRPSDQSTYNAFVSANQQTVEVTDKLVVTVNYEQVVCSTGKRKVPEINVTADVEARTLTFTHTPGQFSKNAEPTDLLYAVVLEKALQVTELFPLKTREDTGAFIVSLPALWDMDELVISAFVLSKDKRKASKTKLLTIDK